MGNSLSIAKFSNCKGITVKCLWNLNYQIVTIVAGKGDLREAKLTKYQNSFSQKLTHCSWIFVKLPKPSLEFLGKLPDSLQNIWCSPVSKQQQTCRKIFVSTLFICLPLLIYSRLQKNWTTFRLVKTWNHFYEVAMLHSSLF